MTSGDEFDPNDPDMEAAWWTRLLDSGSPMSDLDRERFHQWLLAPANRRALNAYRALVSVIAELPEKKSALLVARPPRMKLAPGSRLATVARFLLPEALFKRYVQPPIADMQQEYIGALAKGDLWHARWIAFRGHLLVIPSWVYALLWGKLHELLGRGK